jgi:hypothetical protein
VKLEEAASAIEVVSCGIDSKQDFPLAPVVDSSPVKYHDIKEDENLLLCYEEVDYPEESEGEDDTLSGSISGSSHAHYSTMVVSSDVSSSPAQFCLPSTPSNAVLISPTTPWLTSASPQIGNAFSNNFSPPMQAVQTPTKLHHLPPPVPSPAITGVYSSCMASSPQLFPMFDAGHHFLTGECTYNIQQ